MTKRPQTSQLERRFRKRLEAGGKLFVPYLTAGLPSPQRFLELASDLASVSDAIEVGIPFSDPIMDGPVIQEASARALAGGVTVDRCFALLREMGRYADAPVVVMTYFNPVHRRGIPGFVGGLAEAEVTGLIVPDLPHDESGELVSALDAKGIALVQLVSPTTPARRAATLARASHGYVYAVSTMGVTGERDALDEVARPVVERIRAATDLPILLGIGIGSGDQARQAAAVADGVIVGSAIMRRVIAGDVAGAVRLAQQIRAGLDS